MAKIIIFRDGALLGDYEIEKKRISIGRLPNCDIQIESLAVSSEHATISNLFGKYTLTDMQSTNGTIVNGESIEKHMLQHNDVIEVGNYRLKFVEQGMDAHYVGFEQTVMVKPTAGNTGKSRHKSSEKAAEDNTPTKNASITQPAEPVVLDPSIVAPYAVGRVKARVIVMSGTNQGRELHLNKARIPIGWPGVQVAEIIKNSQGYFLKHVEGLNHPVVNGQSVGAQYHLLKNADEFELAGVKMMIAIEESKGLFSRVGDFIKHFF